MTVHRCKWSVVCSEFATICSLFGGAQTLLLEFATCILPKCEPAIESVKTSSHFCTKDQVRL